MQIFLYFKILNRLYDCRFNIVMASDLLLHPCLQLFRIILSWETYKVLQAFFNRLLFPITWYRKEVHMLDILFHA
jgi:hypothetical protein